MDLNIKNKNALVCGSSRGIGKAAAIEIAKLGANVTLVARNAEKLSEVKSRLDISQGQQHDFLILDFTNSSELKSRIHMLVATKAIHILINNTGGPPGGPITEAAPEEFSQAFHNHIICNQILVQAVIKGMKEDNYGRIVNIISTSVREPLSGLGVSNTIRAAVGNWAKTLANELGEFGITVNNVLPGFTDTERLREIMRQRAKNWGKSEEEVVEIMKNQVPLKRFAVASEIGNAVAFLSTPAASYITGTNLTVDGGRTQSY
jgi:3-oxoacyl-[acyl-carrier protein] reductase